MSSQPVIKSGAYTVAQIDAMNAARLKVALVALSKLYKQQPSDELGKLIVYTLQRLEDIEAANG